MSANLPPDAPETGASSTPALRYGAIAIGLHWLMALLVIGLLGVGTWMTELATSPLKIQVYTWHKWIGLSVLALAVLRLAWRASHRAPPLPTTMPRWQRLGAHSSHVAMYLLLFAMPLSGWLQNSAAGFPLTWFGLFKVPALIVRDKAAFAYWQDVHELLAYSLMIIIALHFAAALKHHFIDRDQVLVRMLPWRERRTTNTGIDA